MTHQLNDESPAAPLRVVIFTAGDESFVLPLVARLERERDISVAAVVFERLRRKTSRRLRRFLRQHGMRGLVAKGLSAATGPIRRASPVRWLDRLAHPLQPSASRRFEELCAAKRIPVHYVPNLHRKSSLELLRGIAPDVGIVFGTRILKEKLFGIPRLGSINIHSRKVPEFRGGGPIGFHEMLVGETEIGITIHQVSAGLDTGNIWATATLGIDERDTPESLAIKVQMFGRDLFVEALGRIARGDPSKPQSELPGKPGLYKSPGHPERRDFRRRFDKRYGPSRPSGLAALGRKALAAAYLYCGYVQWRNVRRRKAGRVPGVIVNFHRVADNRSDHWMTMGTLEFDRYLAHVERFYRVVSIGEMRRVLASGTNSEHLVAFTFDDGYAECGVCAAAALDNRGMTAGFYVCTDFLEADGELDHDAAQGIQGLRKMDSGEVRRLAERGFEIGSHTESHVDFRTASPEQIHQEIDRSKIKLEESIVGDVEGLSVPFGSLAHCGPEVFTVARQSGYRYVLSHFDGTNPPGRPIFHLRRVRPPLQGVIQLHAAIEGWRGLRGLFSRTPGIAIDSE